MIQVLAVIALKTVGALVAGHVAEEIRQVIKDDPKSSSPIKQTPPPISNPLRQDMVVGDVVHEEIREVPLPSERRTFNALMSRAPSQQRILFAKEWSRSLTIEGGVEASSEIGVSLEIFTAKVAAAVRGSISHRIDQSERFEQAILVEVPPGTKQEIVCHWYYRVQPGRVLVDGPAGKSISVPFHTIVGVAFHTEIIEVEVASRRSWWQR